MDVDNLSEEDVQEIGLGLKKLRNGAAFQWLESRLRALRLQIGQEALESPDPNVTQDYYKGRSYQLGHVQSEIEGMIQAAEFLTAPPEEGEPEYGGPRLGGGSTALLD